MVSIGVGCHELSTDQNKDEKLDDNDSPHIQDTLRFFENELAVMSPLENRDDLHEDVHQSSRSEIVV
jgi:hypothetical protein